MPRQPVPEPDVRKVLLEIYAANDPMNQLLLEHLDPRAWRAKPLRPQGRTIAAICAHMHNNRLVWLKHSAPHLRRPKPLDPARCTQKQAANALRQSGAGCLKMLTDALSDRLDRRVTKFNRGAWAPVWPAGATMFAYMFAHEAHHRGQIIAMAHDLGFQLPVKAWAGIWWWNKFWKELGFPKGPR